MTFKGDHWAWNLWDLGMDETELVYISWRSGSVSKLKQFIISFHVHRSNNTVQAWEDGNTQAPEQYLFSQSLPFPSPSKLFKDLLISEKNVE